MLDITERVVDIGVVAALVAAKVDIVRVVVIADAPGVTEATEKLQSAQLGTPEQLKDIDS